MSRTKGPWYVTELETGLYVDGGHEVRYDMNGKATHHVTVVADVHHGRDDARLIAAAPDLLAALKDILNTQIEDQGTQQALEANARDAIRKAEGD